MLQFLKFTFGIELLTVSDSFSVHHQESSTVHTAIGICPAAKGFADSLLASCQQTCITYTIAVCTVKNSC